MQGTYHCGTLPPVSAPDLFQLDRSRNGTSVTLYYAPVQDRTSDYYIVYGTTMGVEEFATGKISPINNNNGVQNYTINELNPNLNYYFAIKSVNGCAPGPLSPWIQAATKKNYNITTVSKQSLTSTYTPTPKFRPSGIDKEIADAKDDGQLSSSSWFDRLIQLLKKIIE